MDSELPLPLRYSSEEYAQLPFWPFVAAPVRELQHIIVLGPTALANVQDWFLKRIYEPPTLFPVQRPWLRTFVLERRLCVATVLPTSVRDEAGRDGLVCAVGFLARRAVVPRDAAAYLRTMLQTLSSHLGVKELLQGGEDELVRLLYPPETRDESVRRLRDAMNALLMIAATARTANIGGSDLRQWLRQRFAGLKRSPRLVLYDPSASSADVLEIFVKEVPTGFAGWLNTKDTAFRSPALLVAPLPEAAASTTSWKVASTASGIRYVRLF